jgi:hypothetical protein
MTNAVIGWAGVQAAQPASGSVTLSALSTASFGNKPVVQLTFTLDAARVTVTDAGAGGSFGALKLMDLTEGAWGVLGAIQNYTAFAEGAALTGAAGDAVFDIGVGSVAKAAAADGALGGATDDNIAGEIAVTLSGGTATASLVEGPKTTAIDGTATAADIVLNVSGSAATIDATSTLDVTGTIALTLIYLGDK